MSDTVLQENTSAVENPVVDTDATQELEIASDLPKKELKKGEYIKTIGRRKTATAQVRLSLADKATTIMVNDKPMEEYFPTSALQKIVRQPLSKTKYQDAFTITAIVRGGGPAGQAEAVRHGITRALVEFDPNTRTTVKKLGYLKRDPRSKERKKPGLKKARKASQWSKR